MTNLPIEKFIITNSGDFEMTAPTLFGLEGVLAEELLRLGAKDITPGKRAVTFVGDKGFMYKANFCLRTGLRILVPIRRFTVRDDANLYDRVKQIDWSEFLKVDDLLAISCSLNTDIFNHTQYISQKTKDAIVDQFREKTGQRPSVDLDNPTLRIHVHVYGNVCTLSLDSSGIPLYKRGYRELVNLAPINECLAAGMILLSGWQPEIEPFYDPMCGSATFSIEAGLIACNIPPGYFRQSFGFQRWADYDQALFQKITESAIGKISDRKVNIFPSDISEEAILKAAKNIQNAGLSEWITPVVQAFDEVKPLEARGVVFLNPPYGERLTDEDLNLLYKEMGSVLKKNFQGYKAWLISSNFEAINNIGLHASKKRTLLNGALECKFQCYELYRGSKKLKNQSAV